MIEFICSAVRFKSSKNQGWYELYGRTHSEIYEDICKKGLVADYTKSHIDGFIIKEDNNKKFIDREQATKIAKKLGIKMKTKDRLTSEDLW